MHRYSQCLEDLCKFYELTQQTENMPEGLK